MNNKMEFLAALHSQQVNGKLKKENNLFGQFVGEWEFDWYGYEPDMETQHEKGEWIFSWILEGRAIQDVWIIPERKRRNIEGVPNGEYGTTIRFYNEKLDEWNVVWVGPLRNRLNTFRAKRIGDEIVLEESNNTNNKMKWIFSEISYSSFKWRSIISNDDGNTWKLVQKMDVKRVNN